MFTCESKVYQVPFRILPAALNFSRPIPSRRSDWEKEPRRRLAQSLPPWAEYMSVSLLRFHHRRPGSSSVPAPPPRYPSSRRAVPRLAAAAKQSSIIPFALALWFANQTPVHHQLQSTLGGCGFEARGWAVPFIMWLLYSFASSFFSFLFL